MTATDDLAELLQNPNAYVGACADLLRSLDIGPDKLAALTLMPREERRELLTAMLTPPARSDPPPPAEPAAPAQPAPAPTPEAEQEPAPPPAAELTPADFALKVPNLSPWRIEHILRQAAKRNA